MARRPETKLFNRTKLSSPHNGNQWFMIQGPHFQSEKEAKKAAADRNRQLTAFGSQTALPDAERVMAAECIKMLAPFGKTLYDATHFYRDYLEKTSTSKTVAELCKLVREEFAFRLANEGTTLRHKRTIEEVRGPVRRFFG